MFVLFFLCKELESFEKLGETKKLKHAEWTCKKHRHLLYRYINQVPLTDAQYPIELKWAELSIFLH